MRKNQNNSVVEKQNRAEKNYSFKEKQNDNKEK